MTSNIGTTVAQQKSIFRQKFGVDVTCMGGKVRRMRTRSLEKREHEYLPSGLSNVADADLRVFEATPTDFQDAHGRPLWPAVGSSLIWHGVSYTVLAVHPGDDEIGGVMITLLLFVYRLPPPDSATEASTAETNPGERKAYYPAPSTL